MCRRKGETVALMSRAQTDLLDQPQAVRPGEELDAARLEAFLKSRLLECAGPLVCVICVIRPLPFFACGRKRS